MNATKEATSLYNKLLSDFQLSLRCITRRFRMRFHALSEEEVASEVNRRLLEYRSKYIVQGEEFLTKEAFNKFAYACTKNTIKWTANGITDRDRRNRKTVFNCSFLNADSRDAPESSWEAKVLNLSKEESFIEEIDQSDQVKSILKWIQDYSDFLTEKEMIVFNDYISGKPQRETALILNETRQSVTSIQKTVKEKVRSHIKVKMNQDNSLDRIKKGYESINHLFD